MMDAKTENNEQEMVSIESLATMTGFPVEMIKTELFNNTDVEGDVSLDELRSAMVSFIDATMLDDKKDLK